MPPEIGPGPVSRGRRAWRPVQIWLPDTRSPTFAVEAHRQSQAVAASAHGADGQAFVDAIAEPWPA